MSSFDISVVQCVDNSFSSPHVKVSQGCDTEPRIGHNVYMGIESAICLEKHWMTVGECGV